MAAGDAMDAGEGWIAQRFEELDEKLRELGPSVAASFLPVTQKLQQTIIDTIATTYSTTAQMNAAIAAPASGVAAAGPVSGSSLSTPGAVSAGTTVTATGSGSVGGTLAVGGRLTANAGMTSTGVRANQVTVGYVAMYVDQNGVFGYAPSTLSTKTLIRNFTADLDKWMSLIPKVFAYKDDPRKAEQFGMIAELVVKREPMLGIYDEQHRLRGVRYELLGVVCLALIQAHVSETRAFRDTVLDRLAALEQQIGV